MSRAEPVALKVFLEESMLKGFIRQSLLHFAAPVWFAKRSDEGVWFCLTIGISIVKQLRIDIRSLG